MTLAGKKVVVVGGSSGIGLRHRGDWRSAQGADVIIASRNVAKLDPVAERLKVIGDSRRRHQR